MLFEFFKYHGNGNDFVIFDGRQNAILPKLDQKKIESLCHRHFGIGADGLILIRKHKEADFEMVYFNSDGRPSSMCGNGGRCSVHFANYLGIFDRQVKMMAVDGLHNASILDNGWISLEMRPTDLPRVRNEHDLVIDTGSPHFVRFVDVTVDMDVVARGRAIRYSEEFETEGINVNFVKQTGPESLEVLTYERGVEDETLACGTGVTAAAISLAQRQEMSEGIIDIKTKGGQLRVKFKKGATGYKDIWLEGPVHQVFRGTIDL